MVNEFETPESGPGAANGGPPGRWDRTVLNQPLPLPRPDDLVTLAAFATFMQDTGRTVTVRSLQRWAQDRGIPRWTDPYDVRGHRHLVSLTDMLEVHRDHQPDR